MFFVDGCTVVPNARWGHRHGVAEVHVGPSGRDSARRVWGWSRQCVSRANACTKTSAQPKALPPAHTHACSHSCNTHVVARQRPSSQTARGAAHDEGRVGGGVVARATHTAEHTGTASTPPQFTPPHSNTRPEDCAEVAHNRIGAPLWHTETLAEERCTPPPPLIPQNIQGRRLECNPSPHAPPPCTPRSVACRPHAHRCAHAQ